ncbi:MAG: hypothetical protein H0W71_04800 [Sphingomonas sp.]|nr:hypothetical protein [Sphingomonas sp.]
MTLFEPIAATPEQLDYLLRRAEQESIAAVRSIDPRVAQPHARMASAFSARALILLGNSADEKSG